MADEIGIRIPNSGRRWPRNLRQYRAYGGVGDIIVVTLSENGRSVRRNIEYELVEECAKRRLRELERKG